MRVLLLPVGDDLYAIEMTRARQVAVLDSLTDLPSAPPEVLGVLNLRGEIVPVFDTSRLLGLDAPERAALTHVSIVETELGPAGLTTTAVALPAVIEGDGEASSMPGALGRHHVGDRLVVLIDPDALVAPIRQSD